MQGVKSIRDTELLQNIFVENLRSVSKYICIENWREFTHNLTIYKKAKCCEINVVK